MTYYYYNKILVSSCKLRKLEPYAGKIAPGTTLQLIVRLEDEADLPKEPFDVRDDGDYYHMSPVPNLVYEIHKSGTLIRAFTTAVSLVEDTIMDFPPIISELILRERKAAWLKD